MNKFVQRITVFLTACLLPQLLCAQSLPKLKQADEISSGVFENGVEYYFVSNDAQSGSAYFALIQSGKPDVEQTRQALRRLEHMDPDAFLERTGVPYTEDGFVSYYQNAKVFRFPDVNVRDRMTADSTMLMMLDLMQLSDCSQTIVVCGDIDRDAYRNLFRTLGLTIPTLHHQAYSTDAEMEASMVRNDSAPGVISLSFRLGSASRENAGTPVPLVAALFAREFQAIFTERLRRDFTHYDIPYYLDESGGDYEIHFPVESSDQVYWLVQSILGDIGNGGVSLEEFSRAKKISLPDIIGTGLKKGKSNAFYVDRIISAVLTGSNLASEETIRNFFSKRQISDKRELSMFNNFASALLAEEFPQIHEYSRKKSVYPDLSAVLKTSKIRKESISATTVDPVTGGSLWTWSNGMKVLYKYLPNTENFSYALALRGDATMVEDISAGESAFLSDLLRRSRIAGIRGNEFHEMLRVEGIILEEEVSVRGLRLGGYAPVGQEENVMKALLKFTGERQMDSSAVDYYLRCRRLSDRTRLPSVRSVMDSLLCPDYKFHRSASISSMRADLPQRAEKYFETRFDNLSDGILIIIGGIPEARVTELLSETIGGFRTSKSYAARNRAVYQLSSGLHSLSTRGDDLSVNLAATALIPVTMDNWLIFQLALKTVQHYFSKEMARLGMYVEVDGSFDVRPEERFAIYLSCRPCLQDGLPEGVSSTDPADALKKVREEFSRIRFITLSPEELKTYKDVIMGEMSSQLKSPEGMMMYALLRYSEGKDICSGYTDRLKTIEIDDVRWILDELSSSGVAEYLVE